MVWVLHTLYCLTLVEFFWQLEYMYLHIFLKQKMSKKIYYLDHMYSSFKICYNLICIHVWKFKYTDF